jgi:hypothetical protein
MTGVPMRLFLSLWVVYCAHFATDFVREHFLVVSIVDRQTFDLDPYLGLHPDIFEMPDGHSFHGANPGASMLAAIPYFMLKPVVDRIVNRELRNRAGATTAVYDDPRAERREFYRVVRENGWDIRFGLVSLITLALFMAPLTAWSAVVLHRTLLRAGLPEGQALGGTLLYALGTPIFFRTGYLSQNLAVGVFALVAFCLLWNPNARSALSERSRLLLAGLLGGLAVLCDYSGGIAIAMLGLYALWRLHDDRPILSALKTSMWYIVGSVGPVLMLWYYQWSAFGSFWRPPQHHMPPVEWSDLGYQGVTGPQWELGELLLFDPRYGLLAAAPLLAIAVAAPFLTRRTFLGKREIAFSLLFTVAMLVFFSSVQYTRLQYFTGIRYMVPVIPFLVLASLVVLRRLPRALAIPAVVGSIGYSWFQAMGRIQQQETSLLDPVRRVAFEGLQLPAFETLERMSTQYAPGLQGGVSSGPALLVMVVAVVLIWTIRSPLRPLDRGP